MSMFEFFLALMAASAVASVVGNIVTIRNYDYMLYNPYGQLCRRHRTLGRIQVVVGYFLTTVGLWTCCEESGWWGVLSALGYMTAVSVGVVALTWLLAWFHGVSIVTVFRTTLIIHSVPERPSRMTREEVEETLWR